MELTEAIHRSLEPDEVLKAITRGLITYMEYTTGFFMVWDGEKDRFEVRSLQTDHWLISRITEILGFSLERHVIPRSNIPRHLMEAAEEGRITAVQSLEEMAYPLISRTKCRLLQRLGGTGYYIVIPLHIDGALAGGLIVTSTRDLVSEEEMN